MDGILNYPKKKRRPEYFDMGAGALNDGSHSNYYAIYE